MQVTFKYGEVLKQKNSSFQLILNRTVPHTAANSDQFLIILHLFTGLHEKYIA